MKYILVILLVCTGISVAAQNKSELQTVSHVDPERYLGKWYEIAAFPQRFEKGCHCTQAEYGKKGDDILTVKNSCIKKNRIKVIRGKATITDRKTNAKLSVQFFWPFRGKYWITELADDYSYAVIGHPNRKYLWILCRHKTMNEKLYNAILGRARAKGFDVSRLRKTDQECELR